MSFCSCGCGAAVTKRIVCGSTICTSLIALVYVVNGPGESGILPTRSIENLTSSAVKSDPSWNLTPLRSLNSHVVSLIGFQDSASPGEICRLSSDHTSVSKICFAASACVPSAEKCGSSDSGPPRTPIVSVCADALAVPISTPAARVSATLMLVRIFIEPPDIGVRSPPLRRWPDAGIAHGILSSLPGRLDGPPLASDNLDGSAGAGGNDMRIVDMNWMQVEAYLKGDDRCILPIGSVEQHAYLSLGVDAILAEKVALDAAEPTGVPVYPVVSYGITPYFSAFPGTISMRVATALAVARDILDGVKRSGFRRVLIVNGHGGNNPVGGFAQEWMADNPGMS